MVFRCLNFWLHAHICTYIEQIKKEITPYFAAKTLVARLSPTLDYPPDTLLAIPDARGSGRFPPPNCYWLYRIHTKYRTGWNPSSVSVDHGSNRGGSPRFLDNHYHTPPNFFKLPPQLSIWIFIPHRCDVYTKVVFRCGESPPAVRFAIRAKPVASRAKTSEKSPFIARLRPRSNEHLSHQKSEYGR